MEDYNYNSLANQLLENGIISSNEGNYELNLSNGENFFEKVEEDNFPKTDIEEKQETPQAPQTSHKRLNEYDSALIKNASKPIDENFSDKLNIVKRFLEFKKTMLVKGKIGFIEYLEYKFFPRIIRNKSLALNFTKGTIIPFKDTYQFFCIAIHQTHSVF